MSWFITNFVATFFLPPLNLLLIFLAGLLILRKHPQLARILLILSFAILWLFSTPFFAESMLHTLEYSSPGLNRDVAHNKIEAIVVLGGGSYLQAPEYGGDTVSSATLERLRYAATLYRQHNKPVLLTGGSPLGNNTSEAELMKQVMQNEFNIPVRWVEAGSNNTFESAHYSYKILKGSGVKRIALITHAWHMPRSQLTFEAVGFEVVPAPTAYTTRYETTLMTFMPNAEALHESAIFWHEIIGMVWYRLKS